jgi:hypothetical protein
VRVRADVKKPAFQRALFEELVCLFDIAGTFLAISLASERFFCAALLARLQIERVTLDFFNDVFLLNLALEAA